MSTDDDSPSRARIRRAHLEDRDAVLRFHLALYQTHRDAVMPDGLELLYAYRRFGEVLREDVTAMLRTPSVILLLAECDDTPVGYVSGYVENDPRRILGRKGMIGDWYVDAEYRGRGVGRQLVEALQGSFREQGCNIVEVSTWPFNHDTRAAFAALGFDEVQITYRRALLPDADPPADD